MTFGYDNLFRFSRSRRWGLLRFFPSQRLFLRRLLLRQLNSFFRLEFALNLRLRPGRSGYCRRFFSFDWLLSCSFSSR